MSRKKYNPEINIHAAGVGGMKKPRVAPGFSP
jgi:hypothetical protein